MSNRKIFKFVCFLLYLGVLLHPHRLYSNELEDDSEWQSSKDVKRIGLGLPYCIIPTFRYQVSSPWIESGKHSILRRSRPALKPTQLPIQWAPALLSLQVKRPRSWPLTSI